MVETTPHGGGLRDLLPRLREGTGGYEVLDILVNGRTFL